MNPYAVKSLTCRLPYVSHSLYYTDPVGNVSTSHAFRHEDHVSFEIEPRFPIMGGWKTTWNQGYSLPAHTQVKKNLEDPSEFVFTINSAHSYEDIVADKFEMKIILPEGASEIKINLPYEMDLKERTSWHYLDMRSGRPELVLTRSNVHEEFHNQEI
jgi:oligosaccharyltransferase complex subunit alpha (ribophorin I)